MQNIMTAPSYPAVLLFGDSPDTFHEKKKKTGVCETEKIIEYSGNISGKSPLRRGSKTREGRRDSFPSDFCGPGLAGAPGAAGFERTYSQNVPTISHSAIACSKIRRPCSGFVTGFLLQNKNEELPENPFVDNTF